MSLIPVKEYVQRYWKSIRTRKAIIVSGFAETERVSKAQSLGVGTYVNKPYLLEKLGLAVKKELERVPAGDGEI